MYNTTISIAELTINIEHNYEQFRLLAKNYITDNRTADFTVSILDADIAQERIYFLKQCETDGRVHASFSGAYLEETAIYRKIAEKLPSYNAVVFHGSAVAVGDSAVIFTALSGTGKTTHTKLWLKNISGSYVVNGDKPIIRIINDKPYVCGTPWNGKEGYGTNKIVPLTALCYLYRDDKNRIERTDAAGFIPHLLEQTYRPENGGISAILPIIKHLSADVSFYNLYCNMEDSAARVAFEGIMG